MCDADFSFHIAHSIFLVISLVIKPLLSDTPDNILAKHLIMSYRIYFLLLLYRRINVKIPPKNPYPSVIHPQTSIRNARCVIPGIVTNRFKIITATSEIAATTTVRKNKYKYLPEIAVCFPVLFEYA